MKSIKHRVTFKILIGYIILGISATFFGALVLSEIKTFTQLQGQDISDKSKIIDIGSLIADIYENESLARAAIQLNSSRKFSAYLKENKRLLLKIDSLNINTPNEAQEFILDSVKVIINKKLKNITDLKRVKRSYNADESISTVINKLSTIDSILNKEPIDNIIKNKDFLFLQTRMKFEKLSRILDEYNTKDTIKIDQKQIDSLLTVSKVMLKKAQKETINQRISLLRKERELIGNDLIISRKLRELLNTLKTGVINYTNDINKQREKTLNRSRNIILFAAIISLLVIIIFSIIFLNDFWKSQRYRKQLEKANKTTSSLLKSREQLISMVSHDLRTPLSTITGYSELLQKATYTVKELNYIEHIGNASTYMRQLVNDLMEFSKLESGSISFKPIAFNLEKTIDEIASNAKSSIGNKPINFIIKHNTDANQHVVSDPFRIKQILNNLVANACKFTNEGTITLESTLKLAQHSTILEVVVTDTGIGIPKDKQKTIFKAFTQVENTKENNQNGFGLGLTISKKLTTLLKGSLTLKSELGKGSIFILEIPVTLSKKVLKKEENLVAIPIFNVNAIVVEDDAAIRELLKTVLEHYQIKSYIFNNAHEALEALDSISYDFVCTDIQLPKMNGIHFMEVLKKHKNYKNQPIIAMTGRLNLSKEDYINIGFSEVLTKPFTIQTLEKVLHQFFDSNLRSIQHKFTKEETSDTNDFCIASLKTFLNNDSKALHKTLYIFLEDTKKNSTLLKQSQQQNDMVQLNRISHMMLSMFKQLKIKEIIPFLEMFEKAQKIDKTHFSNFEIALQKLINSLENYLHKTIFD